MVPPVRWYYILSTWIFILSTLYPLHGISTYPLNLMALVGCFEIVLNPHRESAIKNAYILFIHLAPFLWIPRILSSQSLLFAAAVIGLYLILLVALDEDPIHVYTTLLDENHPTARAFLRDRFGF